MEKAMLTRTTELKRRGKNIETPSPCAVALFTAEVSTLKSNCFGVELRGLRASASGVAVRYSIAPVVRRRR